MKIMNNPLNIKYKSCNNWLGQLKPLNGYCRFKSLEYGFRAGVITYFRLKAFDKNTFKHLIFALYGDTSNSRDCVVNLVNMCNDCILAFSFQKTPPAFSENSNIPVSLLPACLLRLASIQQGFTDINWYKILVNVVSTYMYKCGMIDDVKDLMFY